MIVPLIAAERIGLPIAVLDLAFVMPTPVGGVTWMVNTTVVLVLGVVGTAAVTLTVGEETGMTVMKLHAVTTLPKPSVAETFMDVVLVGCKHV